MPYYSYYKALTRLPSPQEQNRRRVFNRLFHILPNVFIVIGATAVTTVLYPFLSHELTNQKWEDRKIVAPIPYEQWDTAKNVARTEPLKLHNPAAPVIAYQEKVPAPEVINDIDYTKATNWFSVGKQASSSAQLNPKVLSYTLSIPKLNIHDMTVVIGDNNLDKHLVHYEGTALPGQYGNPVIFGHSVLPMFYNPKNYKSVFSKLPTLDEGDEIFVNYDGVEYKYVVESYHEVLPTQVDVLEQRYDRRTISLITCVPPGTFLRRGVILAHLDE